MRLFIIIVCLPLFLFGCEDNKNELNDEDVIELSVNEIKHLHTDSSGHWLDNTLLVLPNVEANQHYRLVRKNVAHLSSLALSPIKLPQYLADKHPHLASFHALSIDITEQQSKAWLKDELFILTFDNKNQPIKRAFVQTAAIVDELYTSSNNDADEVQDFGAKIIEDGVQFKLWAPTAKSVSLLIFDNNKSLIDTLAMNEDSSSGVWSFVAAKKYANAFYQYQIEIYHPASKQIEKLVTTDPYSLSLSTNSEYSHVIDLSASNTQPKGWNNQLDNTVGEPENNIFYETHIRDFSAHDLTISDKKTRGKYKAFSENNSDGIKHLKSLKQAGVNNIHLLPTFDIGTVNENSVNTVDLQDPISKLCAIKNTHMLCENNTIDHSQSINHYLSLLPKNSDVQQKIITELRALDNYNWGYDPFHYTVPEGSYAVNPDGVSRIIEFREMVQSLHNLGFRVIMDVVYNHTHQAKLAPTAVLDKIVPNYYHRLDPISGGIAQSTCCDNTATERVMMEKLMIDSLVVWAKDYKIDGFRFDLMAHQPKSSMLKARAAVQKVDADTYFYGEGWNFGEVANNQRFVQASQLELGGTEIGTFTDRMRDAIRGGAFTASGKDLRKDQGIGNGLGAFANELNNDDQENFLKDYFLAADQLRIGLAGNLADFPLINANDEAVLGKDIPYGDQPTGYALDPADTINYVSKHDNQTLWDNNQYRLPFSMPTDDRVRLHVQNLSFAILAQGIPFLHMGSELLRSKSFLRDSYDYGDWFNKVDFSKQSNNYNVGLPPAEKDQANWPLITELLDKNQGRDQVSPVHIQYSASVFNDLIKIRMSSALFRLTNAQEIIDRLAFHNTGKQQQTGLIVMSINDEFDPSKNKKIIDENYRNIMVFFNAADHEQEFTFNNAEGFELHPIQQSGSDATVKRSTIKQNNFHIPAFTTAVFVKPR